MKSLKANVLCKQGTGLGLPICKNLVERMGSHLEITADDRQFRLRGDVSLQDLSHPQDVP